MPKSSVSGVKRILYALIYSWHGLQAAWAHEQAFRHELLFALVMSALAWTIAEELAVLLILLVLPWLVMVAELLNSAVESAVDRISDEYHELAGRAKDLGSAAVFALICITLVCYLIAWLA